MKTRAYVTFCLLLLTIFFSGCSAVEGIFKAGAWFGIIICVIVVALIIFIISKIGGKKQ